MPRSEFPTVAGQQITLVSRKSTTRYGIAGKN